MANPTISNTYVGDGSTVLYSFTFPYIKIADVLVQLDEVLTTEYVFANATTIQFNVAPVDGTAITIYRSTDNSDLRAVFFPGSAIRARDLNDNFTQSLYVVQEATLNVDDANDASTEALELATIADANATQALAESSTASSAASSAAASASQAQSDASQAQSDASVAQIAATEAAEDAQEVADAVDEILGAIGEGAVISVNGQGGIVSLGVEQLADFAYYPSSEEFTFLGPCVDSNSELLGNAYQTTVVGNELFFVFPKSNTNAYEVLSGITGQAVVICIYTAGGYVELNAVDQRGPSNNGGVTDSWNFIFTGEIAASLLGDYPLVIKSAFIADGQKPLTSGQALIYDQTTEKWRPEDVSLNIGSLPTLP